jgi:hypothetical protein
MKQSFSQRITGSEAADHLSVRKRTSPANFSALLSDRRMRVLAPVAGVAFAMLAYLDSASGYDTPMASAPSRSQTGIAPTSAGPAFPLKASANNRYLVDQGNVPFLMIGDSPQALIGNLSRLEAETFIANRRMYGVNALWINLLCNDTTGCKPDGSTFDGIAPFVVAGDLATPNLAYFQRADEMIRLAATYGMLVILDPIEIAGWLNILKANGVPKAFAYGQYLGNRYKNFPNIIWMHGNDFQSWRNPEHTALVQAVALGIKDADPNHLHTVQLNFLTSSSMDDPSWAPIIGLNAAYTYYPTYAQLLKDYNRSELKPLIMAEANYEFEHNPNTDGGSTQILRRQAYWSMLSGVTGQLYGSLYTWRLAPGWQTRLDTPGIVQFAHMSQLFGSRKWHELIPDQDHTVVIRGRGKYSTNGSMATNTYATAARTPDGSLVMAYMPTIRPIMIDMTKLSGAATARWFDPTNGSYVAAGGSAFANVGGRRFIPPGNNSAGDGDWVLILEAAPPPD